MNSLAAQLKSFDLRNVAGVEDLSRLDILKSNMEKCKATLEEHARWNQVVRETKNILEGGGRLADSADRIETMHRSLTILQNLPSHDERKETFESLSEALLAALRPRVRRDIVSLDLSPLHEYLYVYEKLNRYTLVRALCACVRVRACWSILPAEQQRDRPSTSPTSYPPFPTRPLWNQLTCIAIYRPDRSPFLCIPVHSSAVHDPCHVHLPFTRHSPTIHLPFTCHSPTIHLPFTHHSPAIHPPFTCHSPAIHPPFTCHSPAIHLFPIHSTENTN